MFKKYILENPELIRNCQVAFRKQRTISFTALYFIALISFYVIMYLGMSTSNSSTNEMKWDDYAKLMYVINMGIIYMAYFYIGSFLTSNSMATEKEKGTFDFLRMTTIERKVIATGKLIGGPVFMSYLILLNIPLIALMAYIGKIELSHFLMVIINLVVYGLLFHCISLFCAVLSNKISSANALALMIPMFYSVISLTLPGRTSNPFYALFTPLSTRIVSSENLSFYGVFIPAYLIIASIMIFMVYWFMKGVVRKLDSETNHIFSKKQILYIFLGVQFFFTGLSFNLLRKGETGVLIVYFMFSLLFNTFMTLLVNPSKEDSIIYINREKKDSMWGAKAPAFKLISLLSLLSLLVGGIYNLTITLFSGKFPDFGLGLYLGVFIFLFSLMYTQIFYYCNLTFNKNHNVIASIMVVLSTLIPIPINFITKVDKNIFDIFLLNPLSWLSKVDNSGYFNLGSITQLIILIIFTLILNFIIMSKKEEIIRKFKI